MKIWIYGDSYCTNEGVEYAWPAQLQKITGSEVLVCGMRGVSNDWITKQISLDSKRHCAGDWIIMVSTQESRQWFWEDKPWAGNWQNHTDPQKVLGISREQHRAAKDWLKHLYNQESVAWNSFVHTTWLAAYAMPANIKTLVIPGFISSLEPYNPWVHVTGTLTEYVSYLEFPDRASYEKCLRGPSGDNRPNHLSKVNHSILAEKVATAIKHGQLDLTTGFELVRDPRDKNVLEELYAQ